VFENRVEKYCNRQMPKRYETTQEDAVISLSMELGFKTHFKRQVVLDIWV